ncbi:MAG: TIGR04086 family membrane protein [Eubacteriales bacterium]|nr:TIGR04086 family membrane protein [Eubacteriales bacterium]
MKMIEGKSSAPQLGGLLLCVARGALAGLMVSLAGVFLFALAIGWFQIPDGVIDIVNQCLRIVSVVIGVWVTIGKTPQQGWLKGLLTGLVYAVLTYLVFSLIDGAWALNLALLWDVLLAMGAGAAAGVLLVNLRRK